MVATMRIATLKSPAVRLFLGRFDSGIATRRAQGVPTHGRDRYGARKWEVSRVTLYPS